MIEKINLRLKNILLNYDLKNFKTIAIRYFLYSFGVLDGLLLPFFLKDNPEVYSNIEYYKNAIYLFPNVLLGSYSGYTYVKYNYGVDLFNVLLKLGLVSTLIVAVIYGLITSTYALIFPLIFMNLFTIIEQKLKVEKVFTLAFMFKPLIAIFSIFIAFLNQFYEIGLSANIFILFAFSLSFLFWIVPVRKYLPSLKDLLGLSLKDIASYFFMIRKIFTGILATLVFGLLIFSERFFIEKFYGTNLAAYSFAFNLSQIVVVLISAFSYLSSVLLGEKIKTLNRVLLLKQLKVSITVYCGLFVLYMLFLYLIRPFYPQFDNFILIAFLITIFKGFFFVVGIFSPIAVYKDFNNSMLKAIVLIFVLNVSGCFIMAHYHVPIYYIFISNGVFIFTYSLYIIDIVFRRVSYSN